MIQASSGAQRGFPERAMRHTKHILKEPSHQWSSLMNTHTSFPRHQSAQRFSQTDIVQTSYNSRLLLPPVPPAGLRAGCGFIGGCLERGGGSLCYEVYPEGVGSS
ncbi:unnamed protein product [Boreogadus saida]